MSFKDFLEEVKEAIGPSSEIIKKTIRLTKEKAMAINDNPKEKENNDKPTINIKRR